MLEVEVEKNDNIVELSKEYNFEGEKITELNFAWVDELTVNDMISASSYVQRSGRTPAFPEQDIQYCLYIASAACHMPVDFLMKLSPKDAIKCKNKVVAAFFG